jgi:hypothetical protein
MRARDVGPVRTYVLRVTKAHRYISVARSLSTVLTAAITRTTIERSTPTRPAAFAPNVIRCVPA